MHTATFAFDPARLPFHADSVRRVPLAPGVTHQFVYSSEGPWAINLLDIERSNCLDFRALKAHGTAVGREPTTLLLEHLAEQENVVAGVNADFFSLATGTPVGAHIQRGQVIAGPGPRPVFGIDSSGSPFIGAVHASGSVVVAGTTLALAGWNRVAQDGLSIIDRAWGAASDSGTGRVKITLAGPSPFHVIAIDTLLAGTAVPPAGMLLVAGRDAPIALRTMLLGLRPGNPVTIERSLDRLALREVVGGWPIILRDSAITRDADSAGASFAPARHPRTAVGLANGGKRIIIAVVDGRQKPYSDGMTLRELARFFQSLGATDVINLDGGGSSTFVTRDSVGAMRIRNSPSDKTERPVANALALVNGCR